MSSAQQLQALTARINEKLRTIGRSNVRLYRFKDFAADPWHSLRLHPAHHNTRWTVTELLAWRKKEAPSSKRLQRGCVYCGGQVLPNNKRFSGNTTLACQTCRVPLCKWCSAAWHTKQGRITKKNLDTEPIRKALAAGGLEQGETGGAARSKRGRMNTNGDEEAEEDDEDELEEEELEEQQSVAGPRSRAKRTRRRS